MGKRKFVQTVLSHDQDGRLFFLEMFVEWSFTKHILFVQMVVVATKRLSLRKILKKSLLKSYMGHEAETLLKCS